MLPSSAVFDVLHVSRRVQDLLGDALDSEVHLFAYAACLLSVYEGALPEEWGYAFVGTASGSPFSRQLDEALRRSRQRGWTEARGRGFCLAPAGDDLASHLQGLQRNRRRQAYLDAACNALLSIPVGHVRAAMSAEPVLGAARAIGSTRMLEQGPPLSDLLDQFAALRSALGEHGGASGVALPVWLAYLARLASARPEGRGPGLSP